METTKYNGTSDKTWCHGTGTGNTDENGNLASTMQTNNSTKCQMGMAHVQWDTGTQKKSDADFEHQHMSLAMEEASDTKTTLHRREGLTGLMANVWKKQEDAPESVSTGECRSTTREAAWTKPMNGVAMWWKTE